MKGKFDPIKLPACLRNIYFLSYMRDEEQLMRGNGHEASIVGKFGSDKDSFQRLISHARQFEDEIDNYEDYDEEYDEDYDEEFDEYYDRQIEEDGDGFDELNYGQNDIDYFCDQEDNELSDRVMAGMHLGRSTGNYDFSQGPGSSNPRIDYDPAEDQEWITDEETEA